MNLLMVRLIRTNKDGFKHLLISKVKLSFESNF